MISNRVRHFIAVARAGGFGKAAAELGIAQAPLSQSVQRLERELGVALFERSAKGVTLTAAGQAYLPEAQVAVAASDRARALARAEGDVTGPVRLGVITPALWGPLPTLLAVARAAQIRVQLIEGTTDELLDGIFSGRLDLSFVAPPFMSSDRLTIMDISQESLVAAIPEQLSARHLAFADLAQLAQALVLFPRPYGPTLYDAILALFSGRGMTPSIVLESPRMLTTLALVSAGVGCSVVSPSLAAAVDVKGVAFRPFEPSLAAPSWPVSLAFLPPAERTPAARLLKRVAAWTSADWARS